MNTVKKIFSIFVKIICVAVPIVSPIAIVIRLNTGYNLITYCPFALLPPSLYVFLAYLCDFFLLYSILFLAVYIAAFSFFSKCVSKSKKKKAFLIFPVLLLLIDMGLSIYLGVFRFLIPDLILLVLIILNSFCDVEEENK